MNINISEILKDCPKGMKLYSPLLGNVTFEKVTTSIIVNDGFNTDGFFTKTGLYYDREDGECLLFPSSNMRDWTKFFKRGDVVCNKDGNRYAIFESWANDDYTKFNTTLNYSNEPFVIFNNKETYYTNNFVKASAEEKVIFIAKAKKCYNYKYNSNTLQVEPIKSECKFKPFDKVLVRDYLNQKWTVNLFSYYNKEAKDFPYVCINGCFSYCIPYTGNEHLVGKKLTMTNKEKFNIIYKHFSKPIADMKMLYNNSAMTVEVGVVNSKVAKCFENLYKALEEQLNNYRN